MQVNASVPKCPLNPPQVFPSAKCPQVSRKPTPSVPKCPQVSPKPTPSVPKCPQVSPSVNLKGCIPWSWFPKPTPSVPSAPKCPLNPPQESPSVPKC